VCAVLLFGAALAPELAWAWSMAHVCGAAGCVKGASTLKGYEGWIVVEALSIGASVPFDPTSGAPSPDGKTSQPLSIIKNLDVASPTSSMAGGATWRTGSRS